MIRERCVVATYLPLTLPVPKLGFRRRYNERAALLPHSQCRAKTRLLRVANGSTVPSSIVIHKHPRESLHPFHLFKLQGVLA